MDSYSIATSEARADFSSFLDEAKDRPRFIKRRKQVFIVLPADEMQAFSPAKTKVKFIKDDDGSYFTENSLVPDVIGFGDTKEIAEASFVEGFSLFAKEFYENFRAYSAAPNRKNQIPVILAAIASIERGLGISEMFEFC